MIALNIRDHTFSGLAGPLWLAQAAPLGWLATERLVGPSAGFGEMGLRAMPVGFGVATLVVAWWAGRRWFSGIGAAALVFLVGTGHWIFHFSLELKHYSADAFFGLLLPALVVWTLEGRDARERLWRAAVWWTVAIVGQSWSMGGLLAAPACALALLAVLWRRDGLRSAFGVMAFGCMWLAFLGLNYAMALRFIVGHSNLPMMWSDKMAPVAGGFFARMGWLVQQARPLADNPVGTTWAILFWFTALFGFLAARPRILGVVFAAVPLSAALLALVRVVPLYDRFALWTVPALYVGIALTIEAGFRWARARPASTPIARAAGGIVAAAAIVVCADVGRRGDLLKGQTGDSNHGLDDRSAVEWLAAQRRPGDALITTHLALPAVWWYAKVPVSERVLGSSLDGMPIFEAGYQPANVRCDARALAMPLAEYSRALVYFGFRFDDVPKGFDTQLLDQLKALGSLTDVRRFTEQSIAAIVELSPLGRRAGAGAPLDTHSGCLTMNLAARW